MLKVKMSSRPMYDKRVLFHCPNCGTADVIIVMNIPECGQCRKALPDILGIIKSTPARKCFHWAGKIILGN